MKAAVFHKPGDISVDTVQDPIIEHASDLILKVTATAICGSDLHIYDGFFPQVKDLVMGHEFMGIVQEAGPDCKELQARRPHCCSFPDCLRPLLLLQPSPANGLRKFQLPTTTVPRVI